MGGHNIFKWFLNLMMVGLATMAAWTHKIRTKVASHGYQLEIKKSKIDISALEDIPKQDIPGLDIDDLESLKNYDITKHVVPEKPKKPKLREGADDDEKQRYEEDYAVYQKKLNEHEAIEKAKQELETELKLLGKAAKENLNKDTNQDNRIRIIKHKNRNDKVELYMYVADDKGFHHFKKLNKQEENGKTIYPLLDGKTVEEFEKSDLSHIPRGLLESSQNGGINIKANKVTMSLDNQEQLMKRVKKEETFYTAAAVSSKVAGALGQVANNFMYQGAGELMQQVKSGKSIPKAITSSYDNFRGKSKHINFKQSAQSGLNNQEAMNYQNQTLQQQRQQAMAVSKPR